MPSLSALIAIGLLARSVAFPAPAAGVDGDVRVSADSLSYDVTNDRVLLEGNAVVRRGSVVVRARSATFDRRTNEVRASGGVLLTDAQRAISADAIRAVLGGEMEAEGVLAFVKDRPVDLSGVRTADEAARAGRNRLTFSGKRLRGTPDDHYRLTNARLTLCDCGPGAAPSWEVSAREADVVPGKRAILSWPVLRITPRLLFVNRSVPILVLPWLYLPLGDRQSGLLLPFVGSTAATGFTVAEPLYLTLGRSADATLTPQYAFGRGRQDVAKGDPAVRGPGARFEVRWAPAEQTQGQIELSWFHDLDAEPRGEGGDRWALALGHAQRVDARTDLRAGLRLAGDAVWERDMTPDVLGRVVPYRRSDVIASRRGDAVVTEGVASYIQPLEPEGEDPARRYGALGADLDAASRWGQVAATLLPSSLGPLRLSGRAGAARFGPAAGVLDSSFRPAVTRADARAAVSLPLLVGGVVTFAPWVGGATLGYGFDGSRDPRAAAWGLAGAIAETEVSRRYGSVRHVIAPRLEWRAGSASAGNELPSPAYDLFDRSGSGLLSASPGAFQQLRAALETRLEAGATRARAEAAQDLDLRSGRLAETSLAAGLAAGPFSADAHARFFGFDGRGSPTTPARIPSWLDDLTEAAASVALSDKRGDALRAGFSSVGPGGSGRLVAGLDPLFDVRAIPGLDASAGASAGARAVVQNATLTYDVVFPGRTSFVPACPGATGERRVQALHVQQHAATLAWESPCRCFRVLAVARVTDCGEVSYSASIDLSRLAGAALR